MTVPQATAEIFWTAFKSMTRDAREDFLDRLIVDQRLRKELEDRLDNEAADRALSEHGRVSWESLKKDLKR